MKYCRNILNVIWILFQILLKYLDCHGPVCLWYFYIWPTSHMYEGQCKHRELSFELSFTFCPLLHHAQEIHYFNFFFSSICHKEEASVEEAECIIYSLVAMLFSSISCVFVLAKAQAVYQVQNEEALKPIGQKHAPSIKEPKWKKHVSSIKNTYLQ